MHDGTMRADILMPEMAPTVPYFCTLRYSTFLRSAGGKIYARWHHACRHSDARDGSDCALFLHFALLNFDTVCRWKDLHTMAPCVLTF